MKHQEKKYRVESFDELQKRLDALGAKKLEASTATHYYTNQKSNDVTKLVESENKIEIHILEEADGKFTLKQKIPLKDRSAGLAWLRAQGCEAVDVIKMANTDYEYKEGIVGLYIINDSLHSVILDYPEGQHASIAKDFGLENAEVISVPYNKYLEQIGQVEAISL